MYNENDNDDAYNVSSVINRIFKTNNLAELVSIQRDIKLKSITGEIEFKIDKSKFKKLPLNLIKARHSDAIITGSAALYAFGLLDHREMNDFDLLVDSIPDLCYIVKNDNITIEENRIGSSSQYINLLDTKFDLVLDFLYKILNLSILSYLLDSKKTLVDYFLNNYNSEFIEYEYKGFTYKLHDPIQVLSKKFDMINRNKDKINDNYSGFSVDKHIEDIVRVGLFTKSI